MRLKGEERAVTIAMEEAGAGLVLEGLFVAGPEPGGALIAPPHPLFGGSMDSPVVSELAWACGRVGFSSLRFNWRGVGASAGHATGDAGAGERDVEATLAQLAESVTGDLVGCGYSFGTGSVARVAAREPRIRRLVLVAPPADLLEESLLDALDAEILLVAGEQDSLSPPHRLRALAGTRSRTRFVEIEEADHFFAVGLGELGAAVTDWLRGD